MSIWFQQQTLEALNAWCRGTMMEFLDIRISELGPDYLVGTMPVDHRTYQNFGILHGGASAALAETLGSMAGNMCVDPARTRCVGQEINANHLRSMRSGLARGIARPIHLGARSQVWDIRILDEQDRLVCVSRLTMAVIGKPQEGWVVTR